MLVMRNFTVKNVELEGLLIAVATDETGADWYESQKLFNPDALKIVFDSNGVIISMHHDVSALWPGYCSIAEIAPEDVPEGFCANGEWVFDGERIRPRTYGAEEWQKKAENKRQTLLSEATNATSDWRTELQLSIISDEDKARLSDWMIYIKAVKAVDVSQVKDEETFDKIEWPPKPE